MGLIRTRSVDAGYWRGKERKKERKTDDDDMSLQDFSTSAKLLTTLAVVPHAQKIVRFNLYITCCTQSDWSSRLVDYSFY